MRTSAIRVGAAAAVVVLTVVLAAPARGQGYPDRPYLGPYSVYNPGLTSLRPAYVTVPTTTQLNLQTTVTVPDRGSVTLGGYDRYSDGRNEYGAPGLGKVPYGDRGFRNVGYGRDVKSVRTVVGVRIINLEEEEERQTGVRSGR